uniref:Uncharacterized protein n=1 Tax=Arundo donax TaxID=35708 RepID=A0A0A9BHB8_ARUDO
MSCADQLITNQCQKKSC